MIEIIGNVGTKGYALPMVSAYPTDINSQYLLAWNPVDQALDYVPYAGNSLGDFTVSRDLAVTRNLAVTGTATLTGVAAINGGITPTDGTLEVTGNVELAGNLTASGTVGVTSGANTSVLNSVGLNFQGTKVIGIRRPGWTAATGTATRTAFDTGTVTLPQLAEHVKALLDDLIAHGMIGA